MTTSEPNAGTDNKQIAIYVALSLLLCCGLPILPLYLWRKGKLSAQWGIGLAVAWVGLYVILGIVGALTEPPKTDNKSEEATGKTVDEKADKKLDEEAAKQRKAQEQARMIVRAEMLAKAELPDIPYWEGATFKGVLQGDDKVCVDRTKKDGTNAGFVVVSFPSEKIGEPQDGTCAKPAPKPIDWEKKLTDALKDELGASNRDVKHLTDVTYVDGVNVPVVTWAIDESLSDSMTKKQAKMELTGMLKVLQEMNKKDKMPLEGATFEGTYVLVDKLGNESEERVVLARYDAETIKAINFENFDFNDVYDIAESVQLHPAFQ